MNVYQSADTDELKKC